MSVLEFLKLLVSKETRDALGDAFELFKKNPQWQKGIYSYNYTFSKKEQYSVSNFISFTVKLLKEKYWDTDRIIEIEFACKELINNSFIHNKSRRKLKVKISIKITDEVFIITISDNGKGFCLADEIQRQRFNPHGLFFTLRIASELKQESRNIITAIIKRHQALFNIHNKIGYDVFKLDGRYESEGLNGLKSKFALLCEAGFAGKVIVDISELYSVDSAGLSFILYIQRSLKKDNIECVFVFPKAEYPTYRLLIISQIDQVLPHVDNITQAMIQLNISLDK